MKMRKGFRILLCLLLAGLSTFSANAQVEGSRTDFKAIDQYITTKMRMAHIPGLAVAIVNKDEVVYLRGYGRADPSGRQVTPKTPFMIGSISKPFTALAVMQLAESAKISLDAPVQQYLPWFSLKDPTQSAKITVRQLLTMTSGIPQQPTLVTWTWPDTDLAIERHVRYLVNVKADGPAGRSFQYSNSNYVVLGAIIQAVSGLPYEEYVRRNIFVPLDMEHSYASQDEAMKNGMAMGHRWWFGFPVAVRLPFNRSNLPAGFLISSAEDMAHFLISQMNEGHYRNVSVLSPDGIARMHTFPFPNAYGLGWESVQVNGRTIINHDGGTANFQASIFFDAKERVGVFIAANVVNALDTFSSPSGASPLDGPTVRAMAESILCMFLNEPLPQQGPGIRRLSTIFDLAIAVMSLMLITSIVRMPARQKRLRERGIPQESNIILRYGSIAALHFLWPLVIFYLTFEVPSYKVNIMMYQPDLGYWLVIAAGIVFLKGLQEMIFLRRVSRISHSDTMTSHG